jgi:hypothetical protein
MSTALMLGYFIVPRRYPSARLDSAGLDAVVRLAREGTREEHAARDDSWGRMIAKAVATAALRGILGYIGNRVATSSIATEEVETA